MKINEVKEILYHKWSRKSGSAQSAKHDFNKTVLHFCCVFCRYGELGHVCF